MTCMPAKSLLESYLDDELDAAQITHVDEHQANCTCCAGVQAELLELRAGIRAHAPYYRAPDGLREHIQASVRQADHKPPPSRPILALDGDCGRHPAGGFGCMEYRSVPFAHFQPGSGRAGRLIDR
jgi:hypothetical protein